jgi:hypothetical protein
MKTPELFEHFEVERVPRWPLLVRLLGGSIILHAVLLACAFYVPAVRNALNLASIFSGTGYVDQAYRKTSIGDRAQIINLPKFQYPEGYFYKGPPPPDPNVPQIIVQAQPVIIQPPPIMKMPKVKLTPSPSPSASPSPISDPDGTAQVATSGNGPGDGKTPEQLEAEMDKIAADNKIARPNETDINTRPLKDWLADANALKTKGELDLSKTVEVVISAQLDADGKLIDPVIVQKAGDETMIKVAADMVAKLNDSNALSFLKKFNQNGLSGKQVRFTLKLDQTDVVAKVESEVESAQRAQEIASGFNLLLVFGQKAKAGQDEEVIYRNTKVSSTGNQVIVNFTMPRQTAGEMVRKQLPPAT